MGCVLLDLFFEQMPFVMEPLLFALAIFGKSLVVYVWVGYQVWSPNLALMFGARLSFSSVEDGGERKNLKA